jgi:hypothetical protein
VRCGAKIIFAPTHGLLKIPQKLPELFSAHAPCRLDKDFVPQADIGAGKFLLAPALL